MDTVLARREDVKRRWIELDATDQILGRLAVKATTILMGKEKPDFTPGVDTGDFVLVTNAKAVRASGRKETRKLYFEHTEYVGSGKYVPLAEIRSKKPEKLIYLAVKRMLPKNTMGDHQLRRLKVYPGAEHPHGAQQPQKGQVPQKVRAPKKKAAAATPAKKHEKEGKGK